MDGTSSATDVGDVPIVEALRAGDEEAFRKLIRENNTALVRTAMTYVRTRDLADDVVQETWLGVLRGLDRFEGRSSLRTWIFTILTNIAKTRALREGRTLPFSAVPDASGEPSVDPDRFRPADAPYLPHHWASPPRAWDLPEERAIASETRARVAAAIDALPAGQRTVITLRDVDGWTSSEVCNVLEITETNQRVLLHRARSKVRRELEKYLAGEER